MKVYGPYTRKDGRKHVIVYLDGTKTSRRTVSYPKYLMEQHLGKALAPDETVDHIDRDFTNDAITNLRVISRSNHASEDNKRVRLFEITCVWCGVRVFKEPHDLRGNAKQGKAGPFCSKSCVGKYGAEVQNKRIKPFESQPTVESEYYWIDKSRGSGEIGSTRES